MPAGNSLAKLIPDRFETDRERAYCKSRILNGLKPKKG